MELRNEYEAIRSRAIQGLCVPANQVTVGTVIDAVREAVTACQELADRPPRELTDAEIKSACDSIDFSVLVTADDYLYVVSRAAIAAHIAKQRETQVVKFRAYRDRTEGKIWMARVDADLAPGLEWLEPAQEFEVKCV